MGRRASQGLNQGGVGEGWERILTSFMNPQTISKLTQIRKSVSRRVTSSTAGKSEGKVSAAATLPNLDFDAPMQATTPISLLHLDLKKHRNYLPKPTVWEACGTQISFFSFGGNHIFGLLFRTSPRALESPMGEWWFPLGPDLAMLPYI